MSGSFWDQMLWAYDNFFWTKVFEKSITLPPNPYKSRAHFKEYLQMITDHEEPVDAENETGRAEDTEETA